MPANLRPVSSRKEDLRCIKTAKALDIAMFSLLEKRNFRRITVHNICAEALISRATFYAHYPDKYDFLKDWLTRICPQDLTFDEPYEYIENIINTFMFKHKSIIKNIVRDAAEETLEVLQNIIFSFLKVRPKADNMDLDPRHVIFLNIYAGGIVQYILWQVKNNFPDHFLPMNRYLYEFIKNCREL